jgi:hypothetical protein
MTNTRTITVRGIECDSASEAIQCLDCTRADNAVSIGRRYFALTKAEADRLDAMGVIDAYWFDRDGILMSVPCN